jgi:hypothetical protein
MRELPEFSVVRRDLDPILPGLYAAVEYGAQVGEEFFTQQGTPQDPYLFAHLLRFFAQRHLKSAGEDLEELALDPQGNNGVLIRYGKYQLRLLKARKNGLPLPGHSQSRLAEYRQVAFFDGFTGWDNCSLQATISLLMLWDVDPRKRVVGLSLALPQAGFADPQSYRCHWMQPLSHPTETMMTETDAMAPAVEFEDLPISVNVEPDEDIADGEDDVPVLLPKASNSDADADKLINGCRRA